MHVMFIIKINIMQTPCHGTNIVFMKVGFRHPQESWNHIDPHFGNKRNHYNEIWNKFSHLMKLNIYLILVFSSHFKTSYFY